MEDCYYLMALKAENSLCGENERFQVRSHLACDHNGNDLEGSGGQTQTRLNGDNGIFLLI